MSRCLIEMKRTVSVVVAAAFLGGCQSAPRDTVPETIKGQFVKVAQNLRAFPPPREFSEPSVAPPYGNWPRNTPGVSEYQTLIQNNYAVPILVSLLRDGDPKIRTLAAAALVAKGEPRLQQQLGPLLDDQSQTFDEMRLPMSASPFAKTQFVRQTVATAVLRLVEYPNKAAFDQYWETHANRDYCADWFLWQFRHKQFAPLALQDIQRVPSPDREMIVLWIGVGGWPLYYDGFPQAEVMAAAKRLGRDGILAVLRGQPPGSDPDIKPINTTSWQPGNQYYVMGRFLLSHAKDLLLASDADWLLSMEAEQRKRTDWHEIHYAQSWLIAAASLQPGRADQILDEAQKNYPGWADIPLARWTIEGRASLPKVLRWFYGPNDSEERLATAITVTEPNEQFKPLVEAILAAPPLKICNEAMYRFAEFAQKNKLNFDRQFVDWIYAQPPDPYRGQDYSSRTGVIKMSGVARELVRDPRFSRADVKMLYVVRQSLAGSASKLSPEQSARLDSLMAGIDWNLPLNTSESKLQEMRDLLRKFVGE